MPDQQLVHKVCETIAAYLALGNESFEANAATFVRNYKTPRRYDANHVGLIRAGDPSELDALFARADIEFDGLGHRRFDVDALTPPAVEARLALDGTFTAGQALHLLLEGELQVQAGVKDCDIREMLDDDDWAAYSHLTEMDRIEDARKHDRIADLSLTDEFAAYTRAKVPDVRFWLAYVDDLPVAYLNSWPGTMGIGQVEDLFTHPDFRHRGIATALIAHCVAEARARGAGPVLITADPHDTPKHMYAAMGFRPFSVSRTYFKSA
jgi:GNAT superfamily N-acetyltransferase